MRALVTGAAGQDGTILCTMLARDDAAVIAAVKPGTDTSVLLRYAPSVTVAEVDLGDADALRALVLDAQPQEVYNLGGFTAPGDSWDHQDEVRRINVDAVAVLLEAVSVLPGARMFQASRPRSSRVPIDPPRPSAASGCRSRRTPVSKADAMAMVDAARDRGVHAVSAILYNHESPLRGEGFVTRRVSMGVARIAAGLQDVLELGDVETARDWGWAPDYVRGMQLMLRADVPHDYVLATGISHRLSFFIAKAFAAAGIRDWQPYVRSTTDRTRPVDTNILVGDSPRGVPRAGLAAHRRLRLDGRPHGPPRHGAAGGSGRALADSMTDTAGHRDDALAAARDRAASEQQRMEAPAEPPVGFVRKVGRVGKFRARQASAHLPGAVQDRLTRRRHLAHVTVNMGHLTHPALLGRPTRHARRLDRSRWPAACAGRGPRPRTTRTRRRRPRSLAGWRVAPTTTT